MKKENLLITRRDFLKSAATVTTAAIANIPLAFSSPSTSRTALEESKKAKVVLIRNKDVFDKKHNINPKVLGEMVDTAITRLFSTKNAGEAWAKIVKPTDIIGIKSNVWHYLPTPEELVNHIKNQLVKAGVQKKNIRITDREARTVLANCTALINARPLRSHHWAGIGGCIKNYIMFVQTPSSYHDDSCSTLGSIWNLPIVKGKTRLNILVMLTPQFYGRGPHHFDQRYVWDYCGIAVSTDPVAVDAIGAHLLKEKRILYFGEERPVTSTRHIEMADKKHHIGVSDIKNIDLIKLGWKDEIIL